MEFLGKYKLIFLSLGFILVVFILGYLLYAVFFKTQVPPVITEEQPATSTTTGLPVATTGKGQVVTPGQDTALSGQTTGGRLVSETAQGGLTQASALNDQPTLAATLSANGSDLQYYNQTDGKFYRIDKDGQANLLSDKTFFQVENITWSPDKNKAILEYPDGANIVYDFSTDKQITLPAHWQDFSFSPDGKQVVMKSMGMDVNNRWLAVSSADGSEVKRLEALGEKDETVYPTWSPNNQIVAMYTEGVDFDRQEVYFVGLNSENFKSTIVEGRGFEPKFSPSGQQLVYSVYSTSNDLKPSLWVVNADGENIGSGRKNLNIDTWADKCTFSSQTELYCAVPQNLEEGAGLFPEMADNTVDQLYKIDLNTGLKKLVAVPDGSYNMSDIIISANGYYLYFTDKNTQILHKIKLK